MEIVQSTIDGYSVVAIDGEVDLNSSPQLRKVFEDLLKKGAKKIIVDFAKVVYIDSSGLATLIEMRQKLKKDKGQVFLTSMSEKIKSLFEITKLDKIFTICRNQEEALTIVG